MEHEADLDLTETALREWVRQANTDAGNGPPGALTSDERAELTLLQRQETSSPGGGVSTLEIESPHSIRQAMAWSSTIARTTMEDPRFGASAKMARTTVATPGSSLTTESMQVATLSDPTDPRSATLLREQHTLAGEPWQTTTDLAARTRSTVSAETGGWRTGA